VCSVYALEIAAYGTQLHAVLRHVVDAGVAHDHYHECACRHMGGCCSCCNKSALYDSTKARTHVKYMSLA
jgi:hypothetical protein